jgi:hypothetical protein
MATSKPKFMQKPFDYIDSISLKFFGFQINFIRNDKLLREALFIFFFLVPLGCWLMLGTDSTVDQLAQLIIHTPEFLLQKISFDRWTHYYSDYYGLGTHWSASVIYTLLFVGISKQLSDKLEVSGSQNIALTAGFVGLSITTFEMLWMGSYYLFQKQTWILSLNVPQFNIIWQKLLFATPALIVFIGLDRKRFRFNTNWVTFLLLCASIILWGLWINYGNIFPTQQISVQVEGMGTWTSSPLFPQTMYTVDMNVLDRVAIGEMFYVQNDSLHFLNNICKISMSLFFYNLAKIKKIVN